MQSDDLHRYEEVAQFVTGLVESGTLLPESKAPSLRQISKQRGVSLTTALQAYRLLEDKGVLEAKPKSGFYVSSRGALTLEVPGPSKPPVRATDVSVSRLVLRLLDYAADPDFVPLGCAIPSAELLAAGQLDRYLARAARMKGLEYNVYTPPRGDPALRHEIARRALRWGQALAPDDIAITCGCTEAVTLALKAVAEPGDTIAIESPTYFGLLQVIEALNLKALELPTHPSDGVDLESLARALANSRVAACLFSSSFNNPLGCTMPDEKKCALLKLLARHEVPLIEDDIYGEIYFGEERPKPFMALAPEGDVIYCNSFSKTLAPGYRVGWVATNRRIRKVLESKFAFTLCSPALPQAALAELLSSGGYDSHLRRMRRVLKDNVERTLRAVDRCFPIGTKVTRPAGGFVLWVELPPAVDSGQLFEQALAEGICFAPGEVFSASKRYNHCLRLSCGNPWDDQIAEGICALGRLATTAAEAAAA